MKSFLRPFSSCGWFRPSFKMTHNSCLLFFFQLFQILLFRTAFEWLNVTEKFFTLKLILSTFIKCLIKVCIHSVWSFSYFEGYIKSTGMVRIDGGVGKKKNTRVSFILFCSEEYAKTKIFEPICNIYTCKF